MRSRRGWVSASEERTAIKAALHRALVGRGLEAVRYVELVYETPAWDGGRFHSIDYGVEFGLADGATWAITWQQASWNETLLAFPGTIRSQLRPDADVSTWDVSGTWHPSFAGDVVSVEMVGPSTGGARRSPAELREAARRGT